MASIVDRLRAHIHQSGPAKTGPGKALLVYDGRAWPVVKCGAVYVTDEDKAKKVTKNVISLGQGSEETKRKSSSKYTLAIGSSFGHIHTFLKDSDNVLKCFDQTKAEDKCLLLIRKPKSSSKQMLKAASWSNLSSADTHSRGNDTLTKKSNPIFKRLTVDLTLPPEKSPSEAANQNSRVPQPLTNQNSLSNLSTIGEDVDCNQTIQQENGRTKQPPQNVYTSYPFEDNFLPGPLKPNSRQKSLSSFDIRPEIDGEINNNNNNKMGGNVSHSHKGHHSKGKGAVIHENHNEGETFGFQTSSEGHRPRGQGHKTLGPSPPFPFRSVDVDAGSDLDSENNNHRGSRPVRLGVNPPQLDNRNHLDKHAGHGDNFQTSYNKSLLNPVGNLPQTNGESGQRVLKGQGIFGQSEGTWSNSAARNAKQTYTIGNVVKNPSQMSSANSEKVNKDKFGQDTYQTGFKQELNQPIMSAVKPVTSSPKAVRKNSDVRNTVASNSSIGHVSNANKMQFEGQILNERNDLDIKGKVPESSQYSNHNRPVNRQQSDPRKPSVGSDVTYATIQKPSTNGFPGNQSNSNKGQRHRSMEGIIGKNPPSDKPEKHVNDSVDGPVQSPEIKQPVVKTKSLGDLTEGCTFSLVGQKKPMADQYSPPTKTESVVPDFTGSQMMKHMRKYREIQKTNPGLIPVKGKALDDMDAFKQDQCINVNKHTPDFINKAGKKSAHYSSLQHLAMSVVDSQVPQGPAPMKPKRCLPQTPGDVHEKKRHMTDIVKSRVSISSESSGTSPNSSNSASVRGNSVEMRSGGVSATPSDREVSELFVGNRSDIMWASPQHPQPVCNNAGSSHVSQHRHYGNDVSNNLRKSGSFGSHDQSMVIPPGGRLSESGQTTLTSQSTIDSGYITTDPDHETLSTSSYAKSLQQSAHSLFKRHSQKGDNCKQQQPTNIYKGDNLASFKLAQPSKKYLKDSHAHTRSWLENHPGTFGNEPYTVVETEENFQYPENYQDDNMETELHYRGQQLPSRTECDSNNNKHVKKSESRVTELDLTSSEPKIRSSNQRLHHQLSEPSVIKCEQYSSVGDNLKSKGKSISMAQGLNLIGKTCDPKLSNNYLSKSQPKFTGSLKDLLGGDRHIVPIETVKHESAPVANTLPGSWKYQGLSKSESSLRQLRKHSLFQLLQNYNLCAVRVLLPDNFNITDNIRLIECEVVLPFPYISGKDNSALLSPKGSYAKLGSPNSAFKPVSSGHGSPVKSVSMVTIMEISTELSALIESQSHLQKGDLIIEVNERLMVGETMATLTSLLQESERELLLTIARDHARVANNERESNAPTEEDFRQMEQRINQLTNQLQKKDSMIRQLNELCQSKRARKGGNSDTKEHGGYLCSLSDDEFIV